METFLATAGRTYLRLLELHGVDADQLVRDGGYSPELFRDTSARLPSTEVDVAAHAAARRISDPAFALRAARCWHPSDLGALGFAWLASSSLRTALGRLVRYGRILGERAQSKLEPTDKGLRLVFDPRRKDPLVAALSADFSLSLVMDMCRMNFGAALRPLEVTLCRERPADASAWQGFFGSAVRFGAPRNTILLARKDADALLPVANRQVA